MDAFSYLLLGILSIFLYLAFKTKDKKGRAIPGPKGLPIVGSAFSLKQDCISETLFNYAKQYGDIFRIKIFGTNMVVLNSSELVRKAFNNEPYKTFMNDRMKTFYGEKILFGGQSIAFMENAYGGSVHGDLRKGFTRAMHVYGEGRKNFEDIVKSQLVRLLDDIECFKGEEFDIHDLLKRTLTNIICALYGGPSAKDEEESLNMFWEFDTANDFLLNEKVDRLMQTFPFIRFIPSIYKQRYDEIVHAKNEISKRYFHEMKATHEPGVIRGFVDFLIEEQLQAQAKGGDVLFTDERIIAMVLETLTAGVLTTLSTTSTLLLCLMNHPEYQAKIHDELDRAVGRERQPGFADRQNCPYLEACAMESQRLVPALPHLVGHLCKQNIEFEGYDIPENSIVMANAWFIHHDKKVWGDPWTYRPDRFLDDNGQLLPNDHPLRKNWLTFGTGRRQCIGESFARSRVFLFVSTLLQRWTFKMEPAHHVTCDPRKGHYHFSITVGPERYLCRVVPRE